MLDIATGRCPFGLEFLDTYISEAPTVQTPNVVAAPRAAATGSSCARAAFGREVIPHCSAVIDRADEVGAEGGEEEGGAADDTGD